jgi:DNA-binding transcriptional MerR regulator
MCGALFHCPVRQPASDLYFLQAAVRVRPFENSRLVHMSKHASQQRNEQSSPIPDKLYFRIGEVAKLCGVEAYVLRFWETEFPQLKPNKSGTGQRLYRKRDVEFALRIKRLLYSEGYTIAGARQVFAAEIREPQKRVQPELPLKRAVGADRIEARLKKLRAEVREILGILSAPPLPATASRQSAENRPSSEPSGPGLFDK